MRNYKKYVLMSVLTLLISSAKAQTINWASLKEENKHILNANLGVEHSVTYGLGYGYQLKSRLFPIVANAEYSSASGSYVFDDFKAKLGGQIRWVAYRNFQFSTRIQGVYRSYQNEFVRLANFGSDMSGIVGYYRPHWFVSSEVGFDKAIITHFKHSTAYKDQYAGVADGWYQPATGGNFYYGLQAGFSIKEHDIYIKAGKVLTQDFKTKPTIPLYGQLGYNIKF